MRRMLGHYGRLLEEVVRHPERRVCELPLLDEAERRQVVEEWNATGADYPAKATIHGLFEAQAARTPEAVALEYEGEELSYRELDARANQVARYLVRHGVGPETMVGLCVERGVEMVVATLGILKAGGAYVLVSWEVQGCETLVRQLRKGDLSRGLIDWLRTEFGRAKPAVWTTALTTPTSETIPGELYEEDTILGDFLRAIREHEQSPARALNLATFLPDLGKHRALASALQAVDRDERRVLLHEAAVLGLDLLSGEESLA